MKLKCSGDDAKKNKFKEDIGKYFNTIDQINKKTSDEFKIQVTNGC